MRTYCQKFYRFFFCNYEVESLPITLAAADAVRQRTFEVENRTDAAQFYDTVVGLCDKLCGEDAAVKTRAFRAAYAAAVAATFA